MPVAYVTLDGYVVKRVTDKAIGIAKSDNPFGVLAWLPRSACTDGDSLCEGDTDIVCRELMAEEKELDFS